MAALTKFQGWRLYRQLGNIGNWHRVLESSLNSSDAPTVVQSNWVVSIQKLPPFSDDTIWVKVPHLDDLLAALVRENRTEGLNLIAEVASSRYQHWAAAPAYAQITADALFNIRQVEDLPAQMEALTWLPNVPKLLTTDLTAVWPRLQAITQDVALALDSTSPYTRRLGLDNARESLNRVRQSLAPLGDVAVKRWQPVVDVWLDLLDEERAQPILPEGQTILNPYDAGNPLNLRRAALFRGRTALVETVVNSLLERNRPTLALHGPRRMGKTSFLLQLPRLLGGQVIPVFLDLQRPGFTESTAAFFFSLARAVATDAQIQRSLISLARPDQGEFKRHPFTAFENWLDEEIVPTLAQAGNFTLLFCFDEFEMLGKAISAGRIDRRTPDELRHTIQHRQAVSLLFAGLQTLEDLGPNWSSYFISIRPLAIGYLDSAEAVDLIRNPDPQAGFNLVYEPAAVDDILSITRCHPYLVQLACSAIVNLANQYRILTATRSLVAEAQNLSLEMGEPYFRNLWDESTGTDAATRQAGQDILRRVAAVKRPVPLVPDSLEARQALDRLVRYKVLEKVGDGYQVEIELVRRWVAERAPQF